MLTDPIADMLTRIRNAQRIRRLEVVFPYSRFKVGIADVLRREGFVARHEIHGDTAATRRITIRLKYDRDQNQIIQHIERVSSPGRRVYSSVGDIRRVRNGLGISILSTSRGILSDRECRKEKVGGELLCTVW